jgi:AcrR family transcriptional regulator
MPRLRAVHAGTLVRRKEIIQAALNCFSELGYTDTGMSDICTRSGASTGSVYHHFKSKEQLAAAVYMDGIREYQAGLIDNLGQNKDARQGIASIIRYHITWVAENPEWARFLFQKRHESFLTGTDEEFNTLNKHFAMKIAEWFKRHIEEGSIRRLPWDVLIALLLGPCQEFARVYLSGKAVTKIDNAVKELSAAAWQALANTDK